MTTDTVSTDTTFPVRVAGVKVGPMPLQFKTEGFPLALDVRVPLPPDGVWYVGMNPDALRRLRLWLEDATPGETFALPERRPDVPPPELAMGPNGDTVLYTPVAFVPTKTPALAFPLEMLKEAVQAFDGGTDGATSVARLVACARDFAENGDGLPVFATRMTPPA